MRTARERDKDVRRRCHDVVRLGTGLVFVFGIVAAMPSARADGRPRQEPATDASSGPPCFPCNVLTYAANWIAEAGRGVDAQLAVAKRLIALSNEVARVGVAGVQAAMTFTGGCWADEAVGWMRLIRPSSFSSDRAQRANGRSANAEPWLSLSLAGGGLPGVTGSFAVTESGCRVATGRLTPRGPEDGFGASKHGEWEAGIWAKGRQQTDGFGAPDGDLGLVAPAQRSAANHEFSGGSLLLADTAALPRARLASGREALSPALPLDVAFRFLNLLEQQLDAALLGCSTAPTRGGVGAASWIRGVISQLAKAREQCALATRSSRSLVLSLSARPGFLQELSIISGPQAAQSTIELGQLAPAGGAGPGLWARLETAMEPTASASRKSVASVFALKTTNLPGERLAIEVRRTVSGRIREDRTEVAPRGTRSPGTAPRRVREGLISITGRPLRASSASAGGTS